MLENLAVTQKLRDKKREVEDLLNALGHYGSQRKESLIRIKKTLASLIDAYSCKNQSIDLQEVEKNLDQQYGFEEQKKMIITDLKAKQYAQRKNKKLLPSIICLVGPAGVGKTSFAQILAKAMNKKLYTIALGGISESAFLVGSEAGSMGGDMGQIAQALAKTKSSDLVILFDEIEKAGSVFKTGIHDCLLSILDPVQNQAIRDHYLDVELDCSKITFVATANDLDKIPSLLRSRLEIIKLDGYGFKDKKEIAHRIFQRRLAQDNLEQILEIESEAFVTLINKTHEKGVRQMKLGLEKIFCYCFSYWEEELNRGQKESKIVITPQLVNQIIPQDFAYVEQSNEEQKEKTKAFNERIVYTANINQSKLQAAKLNALNAIQRELNKSGLKKEELELGDRDYQKEINDVSFPEDAQLLREEILLLIAKKFRPSAKINLIKSTPQVPQEIWLSSDNKKDEILKNSAKELEKKNNDYHPEDNKLLKEQLTKVEQVNSELAQQLNKLKQNLTSEISQIKEPKKINWIVHGNPWFILFITSLLLNATIGIFLLGNKKNNN